MNDLLHAGLRRAAFVLTVVLSAAGLAFAALAPPAAAAPPSPPFNQCPAVGLSASCAVLIVINPVGPATVLIDSSQGTFDGTEDTLVGVQNNSTRSIGSIPLSSVSSPIFGLDGDGLCAAGYTPPGPAGCPFGPTGYEGPGTSFSGISADLLSGTVNFAGGLGAGKSAYFSLEEPPAVDLTVGPIILVRVNKAGGPMCATNRVGVRVDLVVKPKAGNTVTSVSDPVLHLTKIDSTANAWLIHLKSNGSPAAQSIPVNTATVVVQTASGPQTFMVGIPAYTCKA